MSRDTLLESMPSTLYVFNGSSQIQNPDLWVAVLGRALAAIKLKTSLDYVSSFIGNALSFINNPEERNGEYTFVFRYRGHRYDIRITSEGRGLKAPVELPFHETDTEISVSCADVKKWCSETVDISGADMTHMGVTAYDFCSRYRLAPTGRVMNLVLCLMEIIDGSSGEREYDVKHAYCMETKIPGDYHISIKLLPS